MDLEESMEGCMGGFGSAVGLAPLHDGTRL